MGSRNVKLPRTICVHGTCCNSCQHALPNTCESNCTCCSCEQQQQHLQNQHQQTSNNYNSIKPTKQALVQPYSQILSYADDEPSSYSLLNYIETQLQQAPPQQQPPQQPSVRRRSSSVNSRASFQHQQQQQQQQPQQQAQAYYHQIPTFMPKSYKTLPFQMEAEQEMPNLFQQTMVNNGQEQRPETPVPVPVALPTTLANLNFQQIASILKAYAQAKEQKIIVHPPQTLPTLKYLPKPMIQKDNFSTLIDQLRAAAALSSKNNVTNKPYKSIVPVM